VREGRSRQGKGCRKENFRKDHGDQK
jgi:hypothetical protein